MVGAFVSLKLTAVGPHPYVNTTYGREAYMALSMYVQHARLIEHYNN